MTWHFIETAPKDGTTILAYAPDAFKNVWQYSGAGDWVEPVHLVRWVGGQWITPFVTVETFGGSEYTGTWTETEPVAITPTHWMPLPAAPEGGGA